MRHTAWVSELFLESVVLEVIQLRRRQVSYQVVYASEGREGSCINVCRVAEAFWGGWSAMMSFSAWPDINHCDVTP